jgi:tight adherence protein C
VVIKRRFSAAIDLMSLMMEVGASFPQALETVNRESQGHALGEELERIVKDIELGRPRKSALEDFAHRVADDDVSELVFAVVEGEELGTPMASILQSQAEQMRKKRSQWAEKAAEESQVALVFPAMIIMVACLITVAAPFVLNAVFSFRGY